jgi:predicted Zn-dependent protease
LGEYRKAVEVLHGGTTRFPNNRAMQVFLAMALYNTGECREAVELLLRNLAETTGDEGISAYKRAILFYAGRLDETWR